ncbi:hypothetical protein BU26DRAFT_569383 [Trematosphaeria pertusa]|uniref:Uncharacterized protein n=1 Tax=Trematosphaeria pertusa TaxID=390896 RepID=A0A6A6I242_9PLEO|nr:uncharacterized protein BU26DRAFT_569383 [Trematosphaeria pertusa]KAF2244401.1 hypothetical protein BU26DRAFT_569383 [Trematosphaeria pertusa]
MDHLQRMSEQWRHRHGRARVVAQYHHLYRRNDELLVSQLATPVDDAVAEAEAAEAIQARIRPEVVLQCDKMKIEELQAEIEQLQNEKVAREETEQRLRSTFEAERDNAIQKAKADIEQRTREALQTESETAIQKAKTEAEQELGRVFEILKTEKDIRESLEAQFGRSLAEVIRETRTQTREELAKTHADALRKQERDLRQEYSARYARAFQKRKQVNERIRELLNEETLEQEAAAPRVQQRLLASRGSEDLTDQDQREHTELQVPRGSDTLRAHLQGLTEGSQFGEQLENGDEGWQAHQQRGDGADAADQTRVSPAI